MRVKENKSLYEALSPGQILTSVHSSLDLENMVIPLVHLPCKDPAKKMREKMEIHWLTKGIILCFSSIGRKHVECPQERLDKVVSYFPLLTVKERLSFAGPVSIMFHLEKIPLMGTGVFILL